MANGQLITAGSGRSRPTEPASCIGTACQRTTWPRPLPRCVHGFNSRGCSTAQKHVVHSTADFVYPPHAGSSNSSRSRSPSASGDQMQLELFSDPYGHVEDVMAEDDLRTAEPQMTLEQVLPLFEKVSGLPVVDTEGSVIGVITRKDLRRAARAGLRQDAVVEEVMTKQPVTIGRRAHVAEAAGIMLACKVHRLPVVDGKRRLLGIVSRSDIFRPLLEPHRDLLDFALHREFDASHSPFAELGGTVRSLDEYDLDGESYVQIRDEIMGVASSSGGGGGGSSAASSTVEQSGRAGGSGPPSPEDPGEHQLYAGAYPKDSSSVGKKLALQLRRDVAKVDSSDWQLKYLYDGECEMCRSLVRALLRDDGGRGRIRFVDFSAADYQPELNEDITPEEAVETIHVLKPDGEIVYGTEAVIEMYELVGKGGIVALARNPALKPLVNVAYTVLSRLRLPLGKGVESLVAAKRVIEVEAGNEHCGDTPPEEGGCVAEW